MNIDLIYQDKFKFDYEKKLFEKEIDEYLCWKRFKYYFETTG